MINLRRSHERGFANHGWLKTYHTFSFANYYDPDYMGFSHLRVINEDTIAPHSGFDTHDHADMEILTWMIEGELTHQDSLGSRGVLRQDDAQVMSAGTGISHSERNESLNAPVHLLQIWLEPDRQGRKPVYAQQHFSVSERQGKLQVIASPDGRERSLAIGQNVIVSLIHLRATDRLQFPVSSHSQSWVQSISASFELNGQSIEPGDGAGVQEEKQFELGAVSIEGDVLWFEMF